MAQDKRQPMQKTQPRGIDPKTGKPYEPVEIPVPKRGEIDTLLKRATGGKGRAEPQEGSDG